MGRNEEKGKIDNAVVGGDGLALKGKFVDVNVVQPEKSSSATTISDPLTEYAYGLMYISHTLEPSISIGSVDFELVCPGCCFDFGKYPEFCDRANPIACQGLHVKDGKLLEQANVEPFSSTPVSSFDWGKVVGPSIRLRDGPNYGFDVICPKCAFEIGRTNDPAWCYNQLLLGKHLHGDESKETSTGEGVTPKPSISLLPNYAYGPIKVPHISGQTIAYGDNGFEAICPGCAYEVLGSQDVQSLTFLQNGLHVQDRKLLEQTNLKPLPSTPVTIFVWQKVVGISIAVRGPPSYGFDVICTLCSAYLPMNKDHDSSYNKLIQGQHIHP